MAMATSRVRRELPRWPQPDTLLERLSGRIAVTSMPKAGACPHRIPPHWRPAGEAPRLFGLQEPHLPLYTRRVCDDASEAEDVVQETFLKLLQHLRDEGDRSNLKSGLFTVAANACRTRVRWRLRWIPWESESDRRIVAPADEEPDRRRARVALRALPARDRLLLALRAQGLSYREIAQAAVIQEQSVGRLLARAVQRWKRELLR